jgi:hypothetical protein
MVIAVWPVRIVQLTPRVHWWCAVRTVRRAGPSHDGEVGVFERIGGFGEAEDVGAGGYGGADYFGIGLRGIAGGVADRARAVERDCLDSRYRAEALNE